MVFLNVGIAAGQVREYRVVPEESVFGFEVEHLGVATVDGVFSIAEGSVLYDPARPDSVSARVSVDVSSVDTDNSLRDRELRSEDFLDVRRFPNITFVSTGSRAGQPGGQPTIAGRMSLYDTTREVEIPFRSSLDSTSGRLTIQSEFELVRSEYNLDFGILMNTMIGDTIQVSVTLVADPS
jgi:polyisoprenoid-binding protein YceI